MLPAPHFPCHSNRSSCHSPDRSSLHFPPWTSPQSLPAHHPIPPLPRAIASERAQRWACVGTKRQNSAPFCSPSCSQNSTDCWYTTGNSPAAPAETATRWRKKWAVTPRTEHYSQQFPPPRGRADCPHRAGWRDSRGTTAGYKWSEFWFRWNASRSGSLGCCPARTAACAHYMSARTTIRT